jgi:hypothetical protein
MTGARRSLSPECRGFLRRLADHVTARRSGESSVHAETCPACRQVLDRAVSAASWLRTRPPVPEALRSPARLAELGERIAEQSEAAPLLARTLLRSEVPVDLLWPEIDTSLTISRELEGVPTKAPSWLWVKVREQVRREIAWHRFARRARRFRLVVAASILAIGVLAVMPRRVERLPEIQIMFDRMSSPPPLASDYSPVAILRQGGK